MNSENQFLWMEKGFISWKFEFQSTGLVSNCTFFENRQKNPLSQTIELSG